MYKSMSVIASMRRWKEPSIGAGDADEDAIADAMEEAKGAIAMEILTICNVRETCPKYGCASWDRELRKLQKNQLVALFKYR